MNQPTAIEELLTHSGWLHELARRLVRDEERARDLVQDTWIAALRRPPAPGTPARPWLARVLRNGLLNQKRKSLRRADHERNAGVGSAPHSPEELALVAEGQRLLAEAVAQLEEPLRSVIVLRYYRGFDSAAIAGELGIPEGTVRGRISRALDELRQTLDRRAGGDRAAWLAALVPLAVEPRVVTTGGLVASAAAASVLALGAATGWWLLRPAAHLSEPGVAATGSAPEALQAEAALLATSAAARTEREPLAEQTAESSQTPPALADSTIEGAVIFVGVTPPEASIELLESRAGRATGITEGDRAVGIQSRHALEFPSGAFSFQGLPAGFRGRLRVPGHQLEQGSGWLDVEAPASGLVLRLVAKPAIDGLLLTPDGAPLAEASGMVRCQLEAGDPLLPDEEGDPLMFLPFRTDAAGRFRVALEGVERARTGRVWLVLELDQAHLTLERGDFDPRLGLHLGELVTQSVQPVSLRVVDPLGAALPGAVLHIDGGIPNSRVSAPTDAHGETVLAFAPAAPFRLRVDAFGYATRSLEISAAHPGLEIRLEPVAGIELVPLGGAPQSATFVLRSPAGLFAPDPRAPMLAMLEQVARHELALSPPRTHPEAVLSGPEQVRIFRVGRLGTLRLSDLTPGIPFTLETRTSDGRVVEVRALELRAGVVERFEVRLPD